MSVSAGAFDYLVNAVPAQGARGREIVMRFTGGSAPE
jgi:chemotaxis receptor (MCP) glutamine deamidase CheD